jgi:ribosome-binding factor A
MPTHKIQRTNDDIQRVLSALLRNIKDPRVSQGMMSVTAVETTGDLRYSKVYLSVLGLENEKELMKGLKSASGYLRRELGSALSLRYTPELIFELDKSIERGAHISRILDGLDAEADERNDGDRDDNT